MQDSQGQELTLPTPPQPHRCNCGANKLISIACHERCASRTTHQPTANEVLTYARDTLGVKLWPWQEQMIRAMYTPGMALQRGVRRNGKATVRRIINAFDEAHAATDGA